MDDQFRARYVCRCGEREFSVRYRRRDEDVVRWMEDAVRPAMHEAHRRSSPLCLATTADLKIPMSEAQAGIGMRVEN